VSQIFFIGSDDHLGTLLLQTVINGLVQYGNCADVSTRKYSSPPVITCQTSGDNSGEMLKIIKAASNFLRNKSGFNHVCQRLLTVLQKFKLNKTIGCHLKAVQQ